MTARRRKNNVSAGVDKFAWMVTFSDLMTLLMTFFILLLSMSSMDAQKLKDIFGNLAGVVGVLELGEETGISKEPPVNAGGLKETQLIEGVRLLKEIISGEEEVIEPEAEAFVDDRGLVVRLPERVLFQPDSAQLSPAALPYLDKVASFLAKTQYLLRVEGHTDNTFTPLSSYSSNWDLSMARSTVVLRHLINAGHLSPQGFAAVGYADSRPIVPNDTEEGKTRNRRVEIVLFKNS